MCVFEIFLEGTEPSRNMVGLYLSRLPRFMKTNWSILFAFINVFGDLKINMFWLHF